jgi:anti-sigma-K factor RskA
MTEKMRCEEIDELAGAYALNAATPDEIAAIEGHLAGCDKHPEMAGLLATAQRLAALPDEMSPSPELKTRLMAAVNADLAAERAAASRPAPSGERPGLFSRLFGGSRLGIGLAAAAVAVVVLLLIFSPWGGSDDGDQTVVQAFGDIRVEVTYNADEPDASMTVEGLEPAPSGSVYQVWAITDGSPASVGFLEVPEEGEASAEMDVQLVDGQVVAVTVEPEGGSPQPTTEPIFGVDI